MPRSSTWPLGNFYSERGYDSKPIFESDSETEACDFFFKYVSSQKHWHIVGAFRNEADAEQLFDQIKSLGVTPIRNDEETSHWPGSAPYRVFVIGKDIFPVREAIPGIPIKKTE